MDIIFGSITTEQRRAHIEEFERGEWTRVVVVYCVLIYTRLVKRGRLDHFADSISKA